MWEDDEFMEEMLLNPDLYGIEDDDIGRNPYGNNNDVYDDDDDDEDEDSNENNINNGDKSLKANEKKEYLNNIDKNIYINQNRINNKNDSEEDGLKISIAIYWILFALIFIYTSRDDAESSVVLTLLILFIATGIIILILGINKKMKNAKSNNYKGK